MKRLMTTVAAVLVATGAWAELKVGTVDLLLLMRNHSSYEPNRKLVVETEKDYTRKLDQFKAEVQSIEEEGAKLTEEARSPLLSQKAKEDMEKKLVDIRSRYLSAQQRVRNEAMRSQQELQDLEARLLKATTDDLRERINVFAKQGGYTLIVDVAAAPYASPEIDVTDALLKEMGVDPAKAREKKTNEGK